jgi:hypothetical protein
MKCNKLFMAVLIRNKRSVCRIWMFKTDEKASTAIASFEHTIEAVVALLSGLTMAIGVATVASVRAPEIIAIVSRITSQLLPGFLGLVARYHNL